jgi:hypothetical protein
MAVALSTMRDFGSGGAGAGAALGAAGTGAGEPGVESALGSAAHPPRVRASPKAIKAEVNVCSETESFSAGASNDPIITPKYGFD